jgi:hypothetical protein
MFENPEKEFIANFVNVEDGMSSIVLRVNHAKQLRFTLSFLTVQDLVEGCGGTWTSLCGILTIFYVAFIGTSVKKS